MCLCSWILEMHLNVCWDTHKTTPGNFFPLAGIPWTAAVHVTGPIFLLSTVFFLVRYQWPPLFSAAASERAIFSTCVICARKVSPFTGVTRWMTGAVYNPVVREGDVCVEDYVFI